MTFKGQVTLPHPFTPAVDPLTNGLRLVLDDAAGNLIDLTVPGGAYSTTGLTGWKVNTSSRLQPWP